MGLAVALYAAGFVPLFRLFGPGVAVGGLIPVLTAAVLFGLRGALVGGALGAAVTVGLFAAAGVPLAEAALRSAAMFVYGTAIGVLVGWLGETRARLARSAAMLAHAERTAGFGSWETDLATGESTWSAGAHAVLGLTPSQEPKRFQDFLAVAHPADRERVRATALAALRARESYALEHRVLRPDGAVRTIATRVDFVSDAGGRTRTLGVGQDVTEQRQLEARLRVADRMASLGTLAGGVAHEINNPLSFVAANLEFVKSELSRAAREGRAPDGEAMTEALDEALDGTRRIRTIVSDLRTFARAGEERMEPVDVNRVLETALALAGNEIRHRARLVRELGAPGRALADEARLAQVFVNLLVNAAQAIPEGRAAEHVIRVRSYREGDQLRVDVSDTGCGIAPEARAHVFEPFYSTKPIGAGMGLGLSICHGIVHRFGGEITLVESEVGKGTTFRVSLRAAPASEEVALAPPEPPRSPRARVLIVDDEQQVLQSLHRLLRAEHDVTVAAGAVEALERIGGEHFDVILCDLMMPEMSGMDLYSAVSGVASEQAERFVFMTGGAFTPRAEAFVAEMRDRTLEKPVRKEELMGTIRARMA